MLVLDQLEAVQFGKSENAFKSVPQVDSELRLRLGALSSEKLEARDENAMQLLASAFGTDAPVVRKELDRLPNLQLERLKAYLINGSTTTDVMDKTVDKLADEVVNETVKKFSIGSGTAESGSEI